MGTFPSVDPFGRLSAPAFCGPTADGTGSGGSTWTRDLAGLGRRGGPSRHGDLAGLGRRGGPSRGFWRLDADAGSGWLPTRHDGEVREILLEPAIAGCHISFFGVTYPLSPQRLSGV